MRAGRSRAGRRALPSVAQNSYDTYGRPDSGNTGLYQYTGQIWFEELQLYYYKARFYDPTIRRFLNADPIGYADGMNMYAYVGGDPVNMVDPTGLFGFNGDPVDEVITTGTKNKPKCEGVCITGDELFLLLGINDQYLINLGDAAMELAEAAFDSAGDLACELKRSEPASFGENVAGFGLGIADSFTLGATTDFFEGNSDFPDYNEAPRNSVGYDIGQVTSLIGGLARIGYAGIAKVGARNAADGRAAVAFRNELKGQFSGLGNSHPRIKTYDELLAKYGSDDAVQAAAGRTNTTINTVGAAAAVPSPGC